jgi:hypothetical protein
MLAGAVGVKKSEAIMSALEQAEFWKVEPGIDDTYNNEQETLENYEEDYTAIPQPTHAYKKDDLSYHSVEKLLLRCIILALLAEHEEGVLKSTLDKF